MDIKGGHRFVTMLGVAGVASGVAPALAGYSAGEFGSLVPSVSFGLAISLCFAISGVARKSRQIFFIVGASVAAYLIAVLTTGFIDLVMPGHAWSMGQASEVSPFALFVGGTLGGAVLISGVIAQICRGSRLRELESFILLWSTVAGLLAIIGWELGSTLGMGLWYAAHAAGLTAPTETALNAAGEWSDTMSMCFVWQAGMGLVLGIVLYRVGVGRPIEVRQ